MGELIPIPGQCPFCYLNQGGHPDQAARLEFRPCEKHPKTATFVFDGQTFRCEKKALISIAEEILFRQRSRRVLS